MKCVVFDLFECWWVIGRKLKLSSLKLLLLYILHLSLCGFFGNHEMCCFDLFECWWVIRRVSTDSFSTQCHFKQSSFEWDRIKTNVPLYNVQWYTLGFMNSHPKVIKSFALLCNNPAEVSSRVISLPSVSHDLFSIHLKVYFPKCVALLLHLIFVPQNQSRFGLSQIEQNAVTWLNQPQAGRRKMT